MKKFGILAIVALSLSACAMVDETEHCVATRYGKVISERVPAGPEWVVFSDVTCLSLTQQAFPAGNGGENAPSEQIAVITKDSVPITLEVALDWRITDGWQAFQVKRRPERVTQEISNAMRSGARDAGATISMGALFGSARATLDEQLKKAIQAQVGPYIAIERVYVRKIDMPQTITDAWAGAATARAGQQRAKDQFVADSLNARRIVLTAEAEGRKTEIENRAMAVSESVLRLRTAEAMANGLANACGKATTCIIGGSVMDTWKNLAGGNK